MTWRGSSSRRKQSKISAQIVDEISSSAGPSIADNLFDRIIAIIDKLSAVPRASGRLVPALGRDLRRHPIGAYNVYLRYDEAADTSLLWCVYFTGGATSPLHCSRNDTGSQTGCAAIAQHNYARVGAAVTCRLGQAKRRPNTQSVRRQWRWVIAAAHPTYARLTQPTTAPGSGTAGRPWASASRWR